MSSGSLIVLMSQVTEKDRKGLESYSLLKSRHHNDLNRSITTGAKHLTQSLGGHIHIQKMAPPTLAFPCSSCWLLPASRAVSPPPIHLNRPLLRAPHTLPSSALNTQELEKLFGAGDVARPVDCLPCRQKALGKSTRHGGMLL